jgi:hypothetical protein
MHLRQTDFSASEKVRQDEGLKKLQNEANFFRIFNADSNRSCARFDPEDRGRTAPSPVPPLSAINPKRSSADAVTKQEATDDAGAPDFFHLNPVSISP